MIEQIKKEIIENARDYLANGETLDDAISLAIGDLHYYEDLWAIMQEYQTPEDANLHNALELLYCDICNEMGGEKN